jgi:hypothetical protein
MNLTIKNDIFLNINRLSIIETPALHNEDNRIHRLPFIIDTATVHNGDWRLSSCFKGLKIYSCGGCEKSWNCQSRQPSTWLRFEPRTYWMQVTVTSTDRSQQHMEHLSSLWRSALSPGRDKKNYVNRLHHIRQQLFSLYLLCCVAFTLSYATKALRESRGIALIYFWPRH